MRAVLAFPLWFPFFLTAQEQPPPPKCTVYGVAVNAITGEPLARVQVFAEGGKHRPQSTVSGPKGEFSLTNLEPGQYRLKGVRNGYLPTYYGARRFESPGIALTLNGGQETKDLQLKLLPFAVIAGTVRDPEGEALAGVSVAVLKVGYQGGTQRVANNQEAVKTDDLGQFRVAGLAPGRYYVHAGLPLYLEPLASELLVPTFHPASRDLAGARRIEVAAGQRFTGADVTLLRSKAYRVRVQAEGPPGLGLGVSLHERPPLGDGISIDPPSECEKGVCQFTGVPAGSYEVTASASPKNLRGTLEELFFNNRDFRASVPVEVTNSDVDGVHVVVSAGAEVTGRISIAGDDEPARFHGMLSFVTPAGEGLPATIAEHGTFSSRLSLGTYQVQTHLGGDLVVRSIRSETADVMAEGLSVTHAGKLAIEVVMGHDAGKVEGTVLDSEDKPVPGATVVLIPKIRERHDLFAQSDTDQNGRFQIQFAAPGDYQLFAWDDVEPFLWYDPEFLKDVESKGEAVTVHTKGQEQVRLHVIR